MNYKSLLEQIFHCYPMYHKIGSGAYKEGLENIEQLTALVGQPQRRFKSVHVAGTNGKGSVSHLLASFFQEAGYKTGLFTSPHLLDFRERIKVNGVPIPEAAVVGFFNRYHADFQQVEPSFFEMTTALAFHYFAEEKVDIAVIEVGLGGRLDSTNVITPELSVITNISLEHTALLGETLPKIAGEKAGIIKENVPVVVGEWHEETFPVFQSVTAAKKAPLLTTEKLTTQFAPFQNDKPFRKVTISANDEVLCKDVSCSLLGDYQEKNLKTFARAAQFFCEKWHIPLSTIGKGIERVIENTHLLGRWQVVDNQPLTICDTGHNVACLSALVQQLNALKINELHFVIGFVNDKDIDNIIALLPPKARYYACQASVARALPSGELAAKLSARGLSVEACGTVAAAYEKARAAARPSDLIFVSGSTFVVADFLTLRAQSE